MEQKEWNPFKEQCCYDCAFLKAYVNWWCKNPDAIKARRTAIPGIKGCPYWQPEWSRIDDKFRPKLPDTPQRPQQQKGPLTRLSLWLSRLLNW